jgi:hypothetical protein
VCDEHFIGFDSVTSIIRASSTTCLDDCLLSSDADVRPGPSPSTATAVNKPACMCMCISTRGLDRCSDRSDTAADVYICPIHIY